MKGNKVTNLHCTSTTIIKITFALLYKRPSKDLQKNTAAHISRHNKVIRKVLHFLEQQPSSDESEKRLKPF